MVGNAVLPGELEPLRVRVDYEPVGVNLVHEYAVVGNVLHPDGGRSLRVKAMGLLAQAILRLRHHGRKRRPDVSMMQKP
jgi:hypothetical protein